MRAADLHRILARETGAPLSEIDQRTRWIHQARLIGPGRGRNAPHLDGGIVVFFLLSMTARRAVDAAEVARRALKLIVVPRHGVAYELQEFQGRKVEFADTLTFIIGRPERVKDYDIAGFEISEDGGTTWILFNSGKRLLFTDNKAVVRAIKNDSEKYDKQLQSGIDRRLHVGSGLLADLAFRLWESVREGARAEMEAKRVRGEVKDERGAE